MKILKFLNNVFVYHGFFAVFLGVSLLPYYFGGSMILGGEGHYILDFHLLSKIYSYAWIDLFTGISATSFNFNFFITFFLSLLESFLKNTRIINFLIVFIIFYLPFFGMFLASTLLTKTAFYSFLVSFFYVVCPFTLYSLGYINLWNYLSFFMVPMAFWFIVRFYDDPRFFLFFGLFTAMFAFTNANPPLLLIFQISLFISATFAVLLHEIKFTVAKFLKMYALAVFSFAVFNIWWIFVWLQALSADISKMYTADFAVNYARDYVYALRPLPLKIFSLTGLVASYKPGDIYQYLYNLPISYFITLIPIGIVVFSLIQCKNLARQKTMLFLLASYTVLIYLSKGPAGFFGFFYRWALSHAPFFSVFKSPVEKWGVLLIFILSLLLLLSLKNLSSARDKKWVYSFFAVYLLFCSIPVFKSSLIPDNIMGDGHVSSRKFFDKREYKSFRKEMAEDPVTYRILSLPGSLNYQIALDLGNNKYYTGMDPIVSNTGRQYIAAYSSNYISSFNIIFDNLSKEYFPEILKVYNVGKIVINKDTIPWFGFREKESPEEVGQLFLTYMSNKIDGSIETFDPPVFLPKIYTADSLSLVIGDISFLGALAEHKLIAKKPAILFSEYNDLPKIEGLFGVRSDMTSRNPDLSVDLKKGISFHKTDIASPNLIFKRVNPIKYIVQIKNPDDPFWLIFLESYHRKWKIFLTGHPDVRSIEDENIVANYTDLGVKESRSMERFSLSDLKYLFRKPLEAGHFNVNGYANGWLLDPKKLGSGTSVTLVLFFLPQAHACLGFLISGMGLIITLIFLLFRKPKR
ncbi:MAG TPA: hypothetical protein DCL35_02430 [Candidatus Omnitrophica bacterium]|nr:hypothetical protein [Candidatus Omnitrophota bacterium]